MTRWTAEAAEALDAAGVVRAKERDQEIGRTLERLSHSFAAMEQEGAEAGSHGIDRQEGTVPNEAQRFMEALVSLGRGHGT